MPSYIIFFYFFFVSEKGNKCDLGPDHIAFVVCNNAVAAQSQENTHEIKHNSCIIQSIVHIASCVHICTCIVSYKYV